ncbi:MAG: hypothetical protein CME65_06300 [Halobacteriovoraceae bacterium]|nr:hypothetical protein [Halobacteriovoraceae bacterium]|tara:strand:- start:19230 stop:20372 length:1143 start_codon:yes stop_codon:yes gene_type:complete
MTPDKWLEENYLGEIFSGRFEHLKILVEELDLMPRCQVVTIGGTNGKGETARILESILNSHQFKTALNTSPHLVAVNERFVFNGEAISDSELIENFQQIQSLLDQRISYFEFLFLVFLNVVKKKSPDIVILEVGLGGRLDATNVLNADIAAITSISRDHQDILGNSYRKIFFEKAGIFRKNQKVFTSFSLKFLNQLMQLTAQNLSLNWCPVEVGGDNFSQANRKLALAMAAELLDKEKCTIVSENTNDFAKRKSWMLKKKQFDLYPSHNPDGIRKLFQLLNASQYNHYDTLIISFSDRSERDLDAMIKTLKQSFRVDQIFYYNFDHAKSLKREKRKQLKDKFGLQSLDKETFSTELLGQNILVTGSNYFLGEFIRYHSGC